MRASEVYAGRLGWAVVPLHDVTAGQCSCSKGSSCPSSGKHPRINAWQVAATSDLETVNDWLTAWPSLNLGIATGSASGFFVLDVDPDHGGAETLAALVAEHGPMPETAQARTGSGGTHFLFQLPDFAVTNKAGKFGGERLPGLDIRGDGGQIVVSPSVSAKGRYTWIAAPWKTPIAHAPAWLLERLSRAPESSTSAPGASSTDRGFFPAASAEVLEHARTVLEQHGPAIDGDGGGLHTVQAAAILTHDFALSDDEAWPLFVEWNTDNAPPWELEGAESLRTMLGRGRKYGKADYGKRRQLDTVETARKLIRDWQEAGGLEATMLPLVVEVREIAGRCGDNVRHGLISRELIAATGLKVKELDLPKARAGGPGEVEIPKGSIEVTPRLHEVADAAVKAISPKVFARNGVLCEVVTNDRTVISDLETARVQDLMSGSANWVKHDGEKGLAEISAPLPVATIVHARRSHLKIRILEAVSSSPIFLADGSILSQRGYNAQARVFLEPSVSVDVADEPSQADAVAAVDVFRDLLADFSFASPADFSSWLAVVLSPLVKAATKNAPAPLTCISASSPGAGKTMLANLAALIVTGEGAEIRPYNPRDPSEWGKRLTSFVKAASPISMFDNCNGPIGDEGLDRLVTSSTWSDRILGASEAPPLPNVTTWVATGNNIEPVGDTVRRVLMVRLEVDTEKPQERTDFARKDLEEYVKGERGPLLSAALTILRAYHCAGRPDQNLSSWGSFTTWSRLVRGALVFAGAADPFLTQRRASLDLNEADNEAHDFWLEVIERSDGSAASVTSTANQRDASTVLGTRDMITAFALKKFVGRFVDKPRGGRRIRREHDTRSNAVRYHVEALSC